MCGEHTPPASLQCMEKGSSPHVRGAHPSIIASIAVTGIIPACAGSTRTLAVLNRYAGDHPRMCGEHYGSRSGGMSALGSSPHVRGARNYSVTGAGFNGIIPACAGSTQLPICLCIGDRDHPRMCGEHFGLIAGYAKLQGSSPHVRGAQDVNQCHHCKLGIIPACAGSTSAACRFSTYRWDHPRMCGEHIRPSSRPLPRPGSSPHVRGAHVPLPVRSAVCGIIPACAGSTILMTATNVRTGDHPRMCGEH